MEWVETTARSVEEAKEAALDQLGVTEDDAEFQILEEPRPGLFGRLRSEARVRARVRPAIPRVKDERRRRGTKKRGAGRPAAAKAAAPTPVSAPPDTAADESATAPAEPTRARRNPSRARRSRPAAPQAASAPDTPTSTMEVTTGKENTVADEVDLAGQAALAESFLTGLVEAFELEAEVNTTFIDDETFEVQANGSDLGLLIGPKGATLAAVQELTRTAVQRQVTNRTGRILVDVGGYQKQRKEALARFTQQLAEEVVRSGTRKILEPMSAADRKVVHDTCTGIDGVHTLSEGEDPRRRVVIEPAD